MTIRLITFDLDDTLWDVRPVLHSAELVLRDWLARHAPNLNDLSVEALGAIRRAQLDAQPELRHRISELRRRVLCHALEEAGYPPGEACELAELAFEVFLEARHAVQLFPEVHPTLELLANHYTLGVITNGNADVRRLGLADYFHFALCAEELGIGKPDPRPFQEALRLAGVAAEQAVHIGDHPSDDISGAQQAGMRAIWFNPGRAPWQQADSQPDAIIANLAELPAALHDWRNISS